MVYEMVERHGLDVTIFFYNPNIHPREEYEVRKSENKRFAEELGVPFVDLDYDPDEWHERAVGMEWSPERGARCTMCFDMRHDRTALYAHENGFTHITTTNAASRWKDKEQINTSGLRTAAKYGGVEWWVHDWQTDSMTHHKYQIAAKQRFYKQEYCGCWMSLRDTNTYRKCKGLPPIKVPSHGVYADAEKDNAEEASDVVEDFFLKDKSESRVRLRRLRAMYAGRRKESTQRTDASSNNW